MSSRGIFISLEGIDGSGKTTLSLALLNYIKNQGLEVVNIREPGGTAISEQIRDLLLDVRNEGILPRTEALLYAAARSQVVEEVIRPALAQGKIVLADRFLDSTVAYQGFGRGLDVEFLTRLNELCTGGLFPDLTLLLDVDPAQGQQRRYKDIPDRLEKEGIEFQRRVREGYLYLARHDPGRIKIINAGLNLAEVVKLASVLVGSALSGQEVL
ncbi:MAG: dTMP kinase [Syntrophomonadaceae bacterium]|jgi:dTMP kinase